MALAIYCESCVIIDFIYFYMDTSTSRLTFTEDSLSAQEDKPPYPIFVICGGSASSNELPDDRPPINCYNQIEIKWLPDARQYRCRVETRELVRTNNRGVPADSRRMDLAGTNPRGPIDPARAVLLRERTPVPPVPAGRR